MVALCVETEHHARRFERGDLGPSRGRIQAPGPDLHDPDGSAGPEEHMATCYCAVIDWASIPPSEQLEVIHRGFGDRRAGGFAGIS
jgi:hypothetical protein